MPRLEVVGPVLLSILSSNHTYIFISFVLNRFLNLKLHTAMQLQNISWQVTLQLSLCVQDFIIFPLMHSMVNFLEFGYDPCFMVLCIGYLHVHREKTSKMELFIISGAACLPHPSKVPSILQYHDSFCSVNRNENEAC